MKKYIVYNNFGKILRTGTCPNGDFLLQAGDFEFVIEGTANDIKQKIENPGIAGKIVDKTPQEIIDDAPKPIAFEKQPAHITNGQWQDVLDRISVLESEV